MPLDSTTIIEKRAGEKLLVAMDFGPWLSSDETISNISSIVSSDISVTGESISGSRIVFFVNGGEAGTRYPISVTITTSLGQTLIGEGPLKVVP